MSVEPPAIESVTRCPDAEAQEFPTSYRCLAPMGRLFAFGAPSMVGGEKRSVLRAIRDLLAMPKFEPVDMMGDELVSDGSV